MLQGTTGSAPDDFYKAAVFYSMCGPKFCSMNYSSKMDE